MIIIQAYPGINRAGNGDRVRRRLRNRRYAVVHQPVTAQPHWRPPRPVKGNWLGFASGGEKTKTIPANAGRPRFNNALNRGGGDGGVQRVAASLQNADGSL